VSQVPRGTWHLKNSTTHAQQRRNQYADESAQSTYDEKNGTPVYGVYEYWDITPSAEASLHNDYSRDEVAEALYDAAASTSAFEKQG
jgi:hypothetical protein